MRFIVSVILIALPALLLQQLLPWWIIAPVALLVTFFLKSSGFAGFMAGFTGIGLLWLAAAWWIDLKTNSILTQKIAALLNIGNPLIIILITGLIGGIVGGFGGLSGYFLRKTLKS